MQVMTSTPVILLAYLASAVTAAAAPNFVFLVCESTDGRTWREGYQNSVIPLPNIHGLGKSLGGAAFHRHYANSPVCCPSRSTMWSGRHAHNIPHSHSRGECAGMNVGGVWNNYEGLPRDYADRFDQILSRKGGYDIHLSGKQDFFEGSHTLNVRLGSWTKQVQFPYDMNRTGGWREDYAEVCRSNGTVIPGNRSAHQGDWSVLEKNLDWIQARSAANDSQPFFLYQGMNIVHPPYVTNRTYYDLIDPEKIEVPEWPEPLDMHPCDLHSSMIKGCVPSYSERKSVEDYYRKRNVRRIYYAMIAEFDAMVGRYIEAIENAGLSDNTIFIVTSDHGDMQMEHRQTFKMTPYDASVSVPLVIYDPRRKRNPPVVVDDPTQLIDLFPTVLELAGISRSLWPSNVVEGRSLIPLLESGDAAGDQWTRTFVISQFHGMNVAMSWFLVVKKMPQTRRTFKLIQYGTGKEVSPQLFELVSDPDEKINLARNASYAAVLAELEADLRSIIYYPDVARQVASYDKESFRCWMKNVQGDWREVIHNSNLRWTPSFEDNLEGSFRALEEWLSTPDDSIVPCRSATKWPPEEGVDFGLISSIKTTRASALN